MRVLGGELALRGGERIAALSVAPGARVRALGSAIVDGALSVPAGASLHLESPVALERMALPPRIDGHLAVLTDLASPADLVLGGTMLVDARFTVGDLEVLPGAGVTHSPGVRSMHLVVTRTLRVAAGARVDVSGKGLPSQTTIEPLTGAEVLGSTQGNGGSHGGAGGLAEDAGTRAPTYDTPDDPLLPGGGGGSRTTASGVNRGGTGGGVLHVSARATVVDGALTADGTQPSGPSGGSGAGGSVVLRVGALSGTGAITARGPQAREAANGAGGGGLILVVSDTSTFTGVVSAAGGLGTVDGAPGVVTLRTEASAPSIVSTPPRRARIGQPYGCAPTATGTRPLTWSLAVAPDGASVDSETGALSWTPTALGTFTFELVAANTSGAATQRFELVVSDGTDDDGAPRFVSAPATTAHCGVPYRAGAVRAPRVSGEGPWTFELRPALDAPLPPSLRVDPATGELLWTPTASEAGTHAVELRATGPSGVARQVLAVVVECDARLAVGCGCAGPPSPGLATPWWLILGILARLRARGSRGARLTSPPRPNACQGRRRRGA